MRSVLAALLLIALAASPAPPDAYVAVDFVASVCERDGLQQSPPESIFLPLARPAEFPKARVAILRALVAGRFAEDVRVKAWPFAFDGGCEGIDGLFSTIADVRTAARQFTARASNANHATERTPGAPWTQPIPDDLRVRWAAALARETVRLTEVTRTNRQRGAALEILGQLASWSSEGTRQGLRTVLAEAARDPRFDIIRSLLSDEEPPSAVNAALVVWPQAEPAVVSSSRRSESWIAEELTSIVNRPCWAERLPGLDVGAVLGKVQQVVLEDISTESRDEEKVRVVGERLLVDRSAILGILQREPDRDRALARCALHLFHELVHVPQGIGRKPDVSRLRNTGAESTLLHIDLGADHAAALLTKRAMPSWELVSLKSLLADAVAEYPVTGRHPPTARLRKAQRLVSLHLEHLIRGSASAHVREEEYVFADFGPGGGDFASMASGPPFRILRMASLSEKDAVTLMRSADEGSGPNELRALRSALVRLVDQVPDETEW